MASPSFSAVWNYASALQKVSRKARDEFLAAVNEVDLTDIETATEQLKQIGQRFLERYGLGARELAAQWYDYCRELEIESGYTAIVGEVGRYNLESDIGALMDKFAAGEVTDNELIARLGGVMVNQIHREARNLIMENLSEEYLKAMEEGNDEFAGKVGFCRVPVADACAFCVLLASRSFYPWQQYKSAKTAGEGKKYHNDCRCVIMPFSKATQIAGYGEKLEGYNDTYRKADNMRREGIKDEELARRIAEAKAEHRAKFDRGEVSEPWRSINEDLIIMRWNNPGMK